MYENELYLYIHSSYITNTMNYIQSIYRISKGYVINTIDKFGQCSNMYLIYSEYPFASIHVCSSHLTRYDKQTQVTLPEEFTQYKIIKSELSSSPLKYTLTLSNNLCIVFGLNIFTRYISDGHNTLDEYDDNSTISQYLKTYTRPYYRVWITGLRHLSTDIPNLSDIYPHVYHNGMYMQSDPPQTVYIVNGQYLDESINAFARKLSAVVKTGYPQLTQFP